MGRFRQRTPLNVGAFGQFESRSVTRFGPDGDTLGPPVTLVNVPAPDLRTPEAIAGNVEWNQRFGRRVLLKANYLRRTGSHEYILEPNPERGEVRLMSTGTSRYWEFEVTGRYLGGERRDLTVSYVRSRGFADLNNYDQFYGNFRNPIIRANEHSLIPTDVPHRLLVRGTIGLPGQWDIAPVIEIRSGFPWSAVERVPGLRRAAEPGRASSASQHVGFLVCHARGTCGGTPIPRWNQGVQLLGASAERDVQNNVAAPDFGHFFNPIERSIGFVLGSVN